MTVRVLVWASTFGADLWSFTRYLDRRDDVDVRVVMPEPKNYLREGVARLFPLRARIVARRGVHPIVGLAGFRPHVTVLDNHVPKRRTSPTGFVLWHGFGWKGPNDREEFHTLHDHLRRAFGDPLAPNARFRWQCFGPWDFEHRTTVSGFHPDNCRLIGAASHDDLRTPFPREELAPFFPFDVRTRKTVLFAPTWHYGEVFAHWGSDAALFERLIAHLAKRQVNLVVRLHDSFRFPPSYLRLLEGMAHRHGNVLLKFKDHHPDNFLDLQVADVLLTNFSSIANLFYATRRPTVHIYPVRSADEEFVWRTYGRKGTTTRTVSSVKYVWKLPPETNGGLLARDEREMFDALDRALDEPECCVATANAFLNAHMMGADGGACERAFGVVAELAREAGAART